MNSPVLRSLMVVVGLLWMAPGLYGQFDLPDFGAPNTPADDPASVSAQLTLGEENTPRLEVTIKLKSDFYTYTMQPGPGYRPTKIKLAKDQPVEAGAFQPTTKPTVELDQNIGKEIAKFKKQVTFLAPLKVKQGTDLASLQVKGSVDLLACKTGEGGICIPVDGLEFTAEFAPEDKLTLNAPPLEQGPDTAATPGKISLANDTVEVIGYLKPGQAKPGETVHLVIQAEPTEDGWHIYKLSGDPTSGSKEFYQPTLLVLTELSGAKAAPAMVERAPKLKAPEGLDVEQPIYEKKVKFTVPIQIPEDASGELTISGALALQCCEQSCIPGATNFTGTLPIGDSQEGEVYLTFLSPEDLGYGDVAKLLGQEGIFNAGKDATYPKTEEPQVAEATPLPTATDWNTVLYYVPLAMLGGFFLNFMPCVLPVIGLKVMSFVSQGGESRSRIFLLNLYYTLGIMTVFMILGSLAAFLAYGWGDVFQSTTFLLVLACVVWVMALSFLGVWEIPIPGFASNTAANKLASKEGFIGAFSKGILATILATPCTGPFIGSVTGFAASQPPEAVYLIFASIGLGFAMPYLVIGIQPSLIQFMPKPGDWMNTFKQFMGFLLLGTVVFLLYPLRQEGADFLIAVFTLLIGLWASCWWIGREEAAGGGALHTVHTWLTAVTIASLAGFYAFGYLQLTALLVLTLGALAALIWIGLRPAGDDFQETLRRWSIGLTVAGATTAVGLGALNTPVEYEWRPYSPEEVANLSQQGNTVLVDFTADWCTNCYVVEETAIKTWSVFEKVHSNKVVTVKADYTQFSPEITKTLKSLGYTGIPLTVIYPAHQPDQPITLPGVYTSQQLVEALEKAGPSKTQEAVTASAE